MTKCKADLARENLFASKQNSKHFHVKDLPLLLVLKRMRMPQRSRKQLNVKQGVLSISTGLWTKHSPRNREGVLWIYGDSNAGRFYRSIHRTPLCRTVFRACSFSYNWIYPIKNATVEMQQQNFLPINVSRVLDAIAKVIHLPQMNNEKSVILLNHGLHFMTSTNFTTYREVINGIIDLFKETRTDNKGKELKFRGKVIWKTTSAIHRERLRYPHHHKRRFLTRQVRPLCNFCNVELNSLRQRSI